MREEAGKEVVATLEGAGPAVAASSRWPTMQLWTMLLGAVGGTVLSILDARQASGASGAAVLGALLLSATERDLRTGRIPNMLTGSAAVAAAALLPLVPEPGLAAGVAGCLAAALLLLCIREIGMLIFGLPGTGMGDVKLAAVIGLLIGPQVLWAIYLAVLFGGLAAAAAIIRHFPERGRTIPFAPFIALGTICALYVIPFSSVWGSLLSP